MTGYKRRREKKFKFIDFLVPLSKHSHVLKNIFSLPLVVSQKLQRKEKAVDDEIEILVLSRVEKYILQF